MKTTNESTWTDDDRRQMRASVQSGVLGAMFWVAFIIVVLGIVGGALFAGL